MGWLELPEEAAVSSRDSSVGQLKLPGRTEEPGAEGRLQTIGRNIGSGLIKSVSPIFEAGNFLNRLQSSSEKSLMGVPEEEAAQQTALRESLAPTLNPSQYVSQEFLEPKGSLEKIAQGTIQQVALSPIYGSSFLKGITSAFGSEAAKELASSLGAGNFGQFIASLVGGTGTSSLLNKGTKGIAAKIPQLKKMAYSDEKGLRGAISFPYQPIEEGLLKVEDRARKEIGSKLYQDYFDELKHRTAALASDIKKDKNIDVGDLIKSKQLINNVIYDQKTPSNVKSIFSDAGTVLKNAIGVLEEKYPEWGSRYRTGENLNVFVKGAQSFGRFFKDHPDLKEELKSVSPGISDAIIYAAGAISGKPFKSLGLKLGIDAIKQLPIKGAQYKELLANPATAELVGKLWQDIASDNVPGVAQALSGLRNISNPQDTAKYGYLEYR